MLDEDCRKKAEQCMERSHDYRKGEKLNFYIKAVEWYLQIQQPSDDDHRSIAQIYHNCADIDPIKKNRLYFYMKAIERWLQVQQPSDKDRRDAADIYRRLAVADFNDNRDLEAAENYQKSIQQLLQIAPESLRDVDYRELTELYLDLADTCFYISNQQAADQSNEYAIEAFNLIKNKNAEELAIGDPRLNFSIFFRYFQEKTSYESYLRSTRFGINEHILEESQKKRHEDKGMADLFGGICIDEVNEGLGAMMGGLAVINSSIPSFNPINLSQPSSDVDYRALVIEYLRLIQIYIKQGKITDTIKTWVVALQTLNNVKEKTESDNVIITQIYDQICYLKDQMAHFKENHEADTEDDDYDATTEDKSQPLNEQNQQLANSLIVKMSMFSHRDQMLPGLDFDDDLQQDQQDQQDTSGMDCS